AGRTRLAIQVRLDGAAVTRLDVGDVGADLEHLDAQLMAGNTRIAEERHLAQVAADVGAADADAMDANQGLSGAGTVGLGYADLLEQTGSFQLDRFHESIRLCFKEAGKRMF